jgi:biopolymer transport protein ExbD
MKFQTSNEPLALFSYSSLTDIVMLLLIFFLLTSAFIIQTGVKVKLPSAKNNEQPTGSKLVVTIASGGAVYLGNEETSIDQLPAKFSKISSDTTNQNNSNLIIRADKSVTVDLIIKVIDAAKGAGVNKFTIETQKERP